MGGAVGEVARKKLYDAAAEGDATMFAELLQEDPHLLDGVSFTCSNKTPLHIATMREHAGIVREVTKRNPQLAWELDSQRWSALHIAAAKGYTEIASILLSVAPNMCWSRDCHGMNPIHIAAMNGHVETLKMLVDKDPSPATEKLDRGQNVLHLCVKHGQLNALKVLVEKFSELVPVEDDDGDTVLYSAVRLKRVEMVQYLVEEVNIVDLSSRNSKGKRLSEILRDSFPRSLTTSTISTILRQNATAFAPFAILFDKPNEILRKLRDVIMVVVVLIATMAFQATVSPPGGVWQDNSSPHRAGEAVMASNRPKIFKHFVHANTVAFASSLAAIFLLTTGLPFDNSNVAKIVMFSTWASLCSIAVSYGASVLVITPGMETHSLALVIKIIVAVSVSTFLALYLFTWSVIGFGWFIELLRRNLRTPNSWPQGQHSLRGAEPSVSFLKIAQSHLHHHLSRLC